MTSRVLAIAVDCRDAEALARFWCAVFGHQVVDRWKDSRGVEYLEVGDGGGGQVLLFQPVAEGKVVKNRVHLDVCPTDREQAAEIERLVGLGARVLADEAEFPWVVLADPEGNEFCVLPPRR
jgi:catechol 2,3-dioxygenase-like lactoylglutathione lyase family enzyme